MAPGQSRTLMVIGPPAVGKSTLVGEWIRDGLLAPDDVLDPDRFRPFLYGEDGWGRGRKTDAAEEVLWTWIDGVLGVRGATGRVTVLTTAPTRRWHVERREAAALPARVGVLRMWAPASVLVERDRGRARSLGAATVTLAAADFARTFGRADLARWFGDRCFERGADAIEWLRSGSPG